MKNCACFGHDYFILANIDIRRKRTIKKKRAIVLNARFRTLKEVKSLGSVPALQR